MVNQQSANRVMKAAIGVRLLGEGEPCFLAAEIGINHNGHMELAHRMIDVAADVGADGVKFQNYRTEDFISDRTLTYEYCSQGRMVVESQYDLFKRCELSRSALKELSSHCQEKGIAFFSTPTSDEGVADLVAAGAPLLKNGSDYLLHLPLIRTMARTGLLTVLSTGMASQDEIADAVEAYEEAGGTHLVLLICTSSYPTPDADVHLRRIPALAEAFGCLAGFSDHTQGWIAALGAVALGACFIEKHFTLDKSMPGPDHHFSADPAEFAALVQAVRSIERNLGNARIEPAASEALGRRNFRLSCVAVRNLASGQILQENDVAFRRPGTGLAPKAVGNILGRKLICPVMAGEVLEMSQFEEEPGRR